MSAEARVRVPVRRHDLDVLGNLNPVGARERPTPEREALER